MTQRDGKPLGDQFGDGSGIVRHFPRFFRGEQRHGPGHHVIKQQSFIHRQLHHEMHQPVRFSFLEALVLQESGKDGGVVSQQFHLDPA